MAESQMAFEHFRNSDKVRDLPLTQAARRLFWKYSSTEIGQWHFSQDELELMALYLREGPVKEMKDLCLVSWNEQFSSKGIHYFKEYSKRYGPKQFLGTIEDLCILFEKVSSKPFEEDDLPLQLKMYLTLAEEILNHLCWGVYLSYQAGGARRGFTAHVTPQEIDLLKEAMLSAAKLYMALLCESRPVIPDHCARIISFFRRGESFRFVAKMASEGSRGNDGSFFRLRWGAHELQNAVHAWRLKSHFVKNDIPLDAVVAPFYASLSCGAFAHAALSTHYPKLQYLKHVYATSEDHIKMGEWENKSRREIIERLSLVPPLIRPESNLAGKSVLIINYALEKGGVLTGLANYYRRLGATVYLSAVEADPGQIEESQGQPSFCDLQLTVPPAFSSIGVSAWRRHQKHVARSKKS